jgi:DNA replication protein DnaC
VAVTNYRRQMGDSPYFMEVAELLHFLRHGKEAAEHYYEEIEEIRGTPLLVLDDLDFRRRNPWWDELYQILNHRYTARLPTLVTTPQTLANLSLDELGERIASLLGDPTVCSEMRLPGAPQKPVNPSPESEPTPRRRRRL